MRVIGDFLSACDLVGVVTNPDDRVDEYDAHAPTILGKLQAGIDVGALAHYVHELESRQMGLRGDAGREWDTAQTLLDWWTIACDEDKAAQRAS